MNERIRELVKQAKKETESLYAKLTRQEFEDAYNQKFAELIVQECIEVIKPCNCGCASKTEVVLTECIIVEIKEHFGVKE